jgi:hypothetical protein
MIKASIFGMSSIKLPDVLIFKAPMLLTRNKNIATR